MLTFYIVSCDHALLIALYELIKSKCFIFCNVQQMFFFAHKNEDSFF